MNHPKKLEKFVSWDLLIERVKNNDLIPEYERNEIIEGIIKLRRILGEHFPKTALKIRHPILVRFINDAPWAKKWLACLGIYLDNLSRYKNFDRLLKDLKDPRKFKHSLLVIDFAYKFSKAGFDIEFEPELESGSKPDFAIIDREKSEKAYVEASVLNPSDREKAVGKLLDKIGEKLTIARSKYNLVYAGRVYNYANVEKILQKIDEHIQIALEKGISVFNEPEIAEIGIAREENESMLKDWCKERRLEVNELVSTDISVDELQRVIRKIFKEHSQLDLKGPNNIILLDMTLLSLRLNNLKQAIEIIESHLAKYSHISLCIIRSKNLLFLDKEGFFRYKQHVFMRKMTESLLGEEILIIQNVRNSEKTINQDLISKVLRALSS